MNRISAPRAPTAPWPRLGRTSLLLLTLALTALPAAAQRKAVKDVPRMDTSAAINKAVRQPMLIERITKAYTLLQLQTMEPRARRQLQESIAEFEKAQRELYAGAPTAQIQDNYQLLDQLWTEYRALTQGAATLASNTKLAEQNEEVVWIATKGAQLMVDFNRTNRNALIATAGEVRMLTQRIAKLYLFRASGIRSKVIDSDLRAADMQLKAGMERLLKSPDNNEQMKSELKLAETQMGFLKTAIDDLNRNQSSKERLEYVNKACDNILEVMERVTRLYEGMKA